MPTFGYQPTAASRDGSESLPQSLSTPANSSLLTDIILLTFLALAAAAFRTFVRVPLRMPSHSVLQWLPVLILGQLYVRRWWAGLYQGSVIGAVCCFYPGLIMLSFGALAPFSEYVLAGGVVSWFFLRLRRSDWPARSLWFVCPAVGLAANIVRLSYRLAYFLPWPSRVLHFHGPTKFVIFYLFFGLFAGFLAVVVYNGSFRRRERSR